MLYRGNRSLFLITLLFAVLAFKVNNTTACDSVYVKFIDRYINIDLDNVFSFIINNKTYIIRQTNDTTLSCYVVKNKNLVNYGFLQIQKGIATREGYWFFYKNKKQFEGIYFFKDKEFQEKKGKVNKEVEVYPPFKIIDL